MSQKYFDQGGFKKGAFFIDTNGIRYDLRGVHRVRKSINPLRWFRPSPAIIVNVEVGQPKQLTLDEIKEIITNLVANHRWYRQGDQSESEFRNMIASAQSVLEIIDMISFYGEWQG